MLTIYKTSLDKTNKTCKVLHVDLAYIKVEMIITLNVTSELVQQYEDKIITKSTIYISGFQIAPKTKYDYRDYDQVLILKESISFLNYTLYFPRAQIHTKRHY